MNNIIVIKQFDFIAEDQYLLKRLAERKSIKKTKENMISKYNLHFTQVLNVLNAADIIMTESEKVFAKTREQIEFYFRPIGSNNFSLADLVLLSSQNDIDLNSDSFADYSLKLPTAEANQRFADILLDNENDLKSPSFKDIIMLIDTVDASIESKWNIQQMYVNRNEHFPKVMELIKKAEKIIRKHSDLLDPILEEFYRFWSKRVLEVDIYKDLYDAFQLDINGNLNQEGSILIPSIINFNQIGFHSSYTPGEPPKYPNHIRMGVIIGDEFYLDTLTEDNSYGDTALQCLKLMSDKSKLDILTIIKDNKSYGAELAKKLNLTTATISHHMSTLMELRLVTVEADNKRVYYRTNKKTVEQVLEYFKKTLIE